MRFLRKPWSGQITARLSWRALKITSAGISSAIRIVEVGPRDGLQNESLTLSPSDRGELVRRLAECGMMHIEAAAFVSPTRVPQMSDAARVFTVANTPEKCRARLSALVPNENGLNALLKLPSHLRPSEIAVFTAVSETFSQRNTNCSVKESLERIKRVTDFARGVSPALPVRGYVSCVAGCPFEGSVPTSKVIEVSAKLLELGCYEISLGDTIGVATPRVIRQLLKQTTSTIPVSKLAIHCHDTYGQGLANVLAAIESGITSVDASVGGLGGCPFAPGASGNISTEDVVYMLEGFGVKTGVDLSQLCGVGKWISEKLQRQNNSRAGAAILARQKK